jgi:multiple antibiotic resistance protein
VIALFVSTFIKFFFLLTPFFVLSTFLAMTTNYTPGRRTALAIQVTVAVLIVSAVILVAGNFVFQVFGITLDAFRIGTGVLLMLTAIKMVSGVEPDAAEGADNLAVVPLAIPVTVGPATTGALLVMGGETHSLVELATVVAALVLAIAIVGVILLSSAAVERIVKKRGLTILTKITGLILAALAAQLIMNGIKAFLV